MMHWLRHDTNRPIFLDARLLAYRPGGIQRYVEQLAAALARVAPSLPLRLIQNRPVANLPWPTVRVLTPPHHRFERRTLALELSLRRPALVHSVDFIPPALPSCISSVVTVHDLAFLDHPSLLDANARRYYGQFLAALPRADAIIAVSQTTAERLRQLFPTLRARIAVTYLGVSPVQPLSPARAWEYLAEQLGRMTVQRLRERQWVLAVGTIEPRKRYQLLCHAVAQLWQEDPAAAPYLVIIGQLGWQADKELAAIHEGMRQGWLYWITDADDRLRDACFTLATVLAIPSLDEGFSLPALEAMAAGLPVVAAARGALPEILDNAGILIPADDPASWAKALRDVLHNEAVQNRLRVLGKARAQQFSWDETAKQTVAVYKEVLRACQTRQRGPSLA
ncbi:glycosyltransferase family 4 protein [Thermorudis peleae]|uniref:glycosyltransferase family 4 protein n=1 Tax=Thermorudis peleae TaxID=1382356 RepID=UPI00068B9786|nr:glycosyltransferase family 1 protein [Thermorudis peleae]